MMRVTFPAFVRAKDSGDIDRFDSIQAMQRQLERIDVENGEYEAWDSGGAPVALRVQEPLWLAVDRSGNSDQIALHTALLAYATRRGVVVADAEFLSASELFARITRSV